MARQRRSFGAVRRLPSGRWQASYIAPDGRRHTAPVTFEGKQDADGWLAIRQSEMVRGVWLPPQPAQPAGPPLLAAYAAGWMAGRDLSPSTRTLYSKLLRLHIAPAFGHLGLDEITPGSVRDWFGQMKSSTGPTERAHAYGLLRTIMGTAASDEIIGANPCRLRGAGASKRVKDIRPATIAELEAITAAMPPRLQLMVLLASWCGLRFGELAELRRADIDARRQVVHVRRGVVRTDDGPVVKGPKSDAGRRTVAVPPHLMGAVKAHLREHVPASQDALLFPAWGDRSKHMDPATLYRSWYPARKAAGREDLRFHDLRHTGAVLAAATGASLAELMARLGHSSVAAAMRYQHAAADRDKVIAGALSQLATGGTVTPITAAG